MCVELIHQQLPEYRESQPHLTLCVYQGHQGIGAANFACRQDTAATAQVNLLAGHTYGPRGKPVALHLHSRRCHVTALDTVKGLGLTKTRLDAGQQIHVEIAYRTKTVSVCRIKNTFVYACAQQVVTGKKLLLVSHTHQ